MMGEEMKRALYLSIKEARNFEDLPEDFAHLFAELPHTYDLPELPALEIAYVDNHEEVSFPNCVVSSYYS